MKNKEEEEKEWKNGGASWANSVLNGITFALILCPI